MGNPIKNALGIAKTIYYNNKADDLNKKADILQEYNQGGYKKKNFDPGSRAFQVQSVGRSLIDKAIKKAK